LVLAQNPTGGAYSAPRTPWLVGRGTSRPFKLRSLALRASPFPQTPQFYTWIGAYARHLNNNVSSVVTVSTETSVDHSTTGRLFHTDGLQMAKLHCIDIVYWATGTASILWKTHCDYS